MNAVAKVVKPTPEYKTREHRFTKLPVRDILKVRMADLEVKNIELARLMGYPTGNVIAMMKSGSMRLPVNKVGIVAKTLNLDPVFLLGKLIEENDAGMWAAIKSVMGNNRLLTENEGFFLDMVRETLEGHDIDLVGCGELLQATKPILKSIAKRQHEVIKAAKERIDRS